MVKLLLLQLLSLAFAVSATLVVNSGYDRPGYDLPNMPIILDPASQVSDCSLLCANRDQCVSWAYDSCGHQLCWLKDTIPPIRKQNCRVIILNSYTDSAGYIHNIRMHAARPAGCVITILCTYTRMLA